MEVCPTEVIHASPERIWHLLTDPQELARWTETKLAQGPGRPMRAGDLVVLRTGPFHARFEAVDAQPLRSLRLCIRLTFGIVNREQIQITPAGSGTCRVTFN